MCGRYTLTTPEDVLREEFHLDEIPEGIKPRYNIAPSQRVPVITGEDPKLLQLYRWGLIPSWSKDKKIGFSLINARAETLAEKPSFRGALSRRRCLIPSDGFYEWKKAKDHKTPIYITLKSHGVFAFAGLWETWTSREDGEVIQSFTIITTAPNSLMSSIHDRMPVILKPEDYLKWIDPKLTDSHAALKLLTSYPSEQMETRVVSTLVNSPKNDVKECLEASS